MSLFEKKVVVEEERENIVYAPMSGEIVELEKVNDPVFSQKIMGEGVAIKPNGDSVYSPVSGVISMIFPTKHAIGITRDNGLGVILHIGIETVNLNGKGFDLKVSQGQRVRVGELLMNIDLKYISSQCDPTTMIVFDNGADMSIKTIAVGKCQVGQPLLEVGDNV